MKFNPENNTVEAERTELLALLEKHVVPEYDKVIDKFKELMPQANLGLAVVALILAKHIHQDKCELIELLLQYAVEYSVYVEFKEQLPKTETK